MAYTLRTTVGGDFDAAVERTVDALGAEGFGVLCDIDVQATFAEKLDREYGKYRILGACNPELAYDGLEEEVELGTLLPCNVVVYQTGAGDVVVSAVDPRRLVAVTDNASLGPMAEEAYERFERVLDAL